MKSKVKSENDETHIKYSLDMRLALFVQHVLGNKNDWKRLEEISGIKSVRWRHFYSGATKPSADMLEFFFTHYPQHAFWLATGITDYEAGHTAPQANLAFPGKLDKNYSPLALNQQATENYFWTCLEALELCWKKWVDWVQQPPKKKLSRNDAVTLYKLGINTSLQIGASEITTAIGEHEQARLIEEVSQARTAHLDVMISRIREHWDDADKIIDLLRESDAEIIAEGEEEDRRKAKGEQKK